MMLIMRSHERCHGLSTCSQVILCYSLLTIKSYTMSITIKKFMEAEDQSTGRKAIFEIINESEMHMLHPETKEILYKIEIGSDGASIASSGHTRTPHDAGRCMLECSRGCKGDFECEAGCALTCATIII